MTGQDGKAPPPVIHYGRGGAGNVAKKVAQSPVVEPQVTPTLKSKTYTTGRGGTGNMARNDDPIEARAAQDVDIPGIILPEGAVHTGRGGAANTYIPNENEAHEAKKHNEKVRSESFRKSSKDRSGIKGLVDKAKDTLSGKGNHDSN